MSGNETKSCTKCGLEKSYSDFAIDKRVSSGRKARCKLCMAAVEKSRKAAGLIVPRKSTQIDYKAQTKSCSKCDVVQPFSEFAPDKCNSSGYTSWCRACYSILKKSEYQRQKGRYLDYAKQYCAEHPDQVKAATDKWRQANPDKIKAYMEGWWADHPGMSSAYSAKRRAAKLRATPPWLTQQHLDEIASIYINCPLGHHVDHIIPLQGNTVSGLHVPWNLQHLTAEENLAKSNKLLSA